MGLGLGDKGLWQLRDYRCSPHATVSLGLFPLATTFSHSTYSVFLSLPLLEQKLHTEVGVLTSEGLSECLAQGRLNRLKSELQFGAQGLADAKHKKSSSYHHNFPSMLRSRGIESFKLSCFLQLIYLWESNSHGWVEVGGEERRPDPG